jgi:F-type H+-transporting ATPase subunit b
LRRAAAVLIATLLLVPSLQAAEPAGGEAAAEPLAFWKLVNFLLLAGVAGYFIYKKGGPFFAARNEALRRNLEEAAREKRYAEARFAEVEQRLARLGDEIERMKTKARQESEAEGERIRAEIERDLAWIREQTEREIDASAKAARLELRAYAADLAVNLAEKRIRERLTPDSEGVLLEAMLTDLQRRSDSQAVAS